MSEAVILAGGLGTRLRSMVPNLPKPMAPVCGRPFLEVLLTRLARQGIEHVILSVGYLADVIISHFGHRFESVDIDYAKEDTPLGTGGGLRLALRQCHEDAVLVLNGDTFLDVDVKHAIHAWNLHHEPIVFGVQCDNTSRYGRLEVSGDLITGFLEKGAGGPGVINAGSYFFPTSLFDGYNLPPVFSLEQDFLMQEVSRRAFRLFPASPPFIDIGVPEDYLLAQTYLQQYL